MTNAIGQTKALGISARHCPASVADWQPSAGSIRPLPRSTCASFSGRRRSCRQDGTHAIYALVDATVLKVLLMVARAVHADAARMTAALRGRVLTTPRVVQARRAAVRSHRGGHV